jgi:hypothetical protein
MAYEKELDKELFKTEREFFNSKIVVSVMSYNEGTPKIQISRLNKNDDQWTFSKLGRLTSEESAALVEMIKEARDHLA